MPKTTTIREGVEYRSPYEVYKVDVHLSSYSNNRRHALFLVDHYDFEPIATATINISDYPLENDEVFVKNYSENEGMLTFLIQQKIVSDPIPIKNGYVTLYKCKLLAIN